MIKIKIKVPELKPNVSEAFKSLRANLKFCSLDKKVICVTGCNENVGKSTVSLHLAKALAETGNNVCLVDCDLRKSFLLGTIKAQRIDSESHEICGLSQYLSHQASINDILAGTNIPGLYIIFSGPTPPNPAELLSSKQMATTFEVIRQKFDYIIVDTPPIGPVSDGTVIAGMCDGVLLVLESEKDSYRLTRHIKSQIEQTGCPILGVVLNKVNLKRSFNKNLYGKNYAKTYGHYQK